jgi:hypothetical protein
MGASEIIIYILIGIIANLITGKITTLLKKTSITFNQKQVRWTINTLLFTVLIILYLVSNKKIIIAESPSPKSEVPDKIVLKEDENYFRKINPYTDTSIIVQYPIPDSSISSKLISRSLARIEVLRTLADGRGLQIRTLRIIAAFFEKKDDIDFNAMRDELDEFLKTKLHIGLYLEKEITTLNRQSIELQVIAPKYIDLSTRQPEFLWDQKTEEDIFFRYVKFLIHQISRSMIKEHLAQLNSNGFTDIEFLMFMNKLFSRIQEEDELIRGRIKSLPELFDYFSQSWHDYKINIPVESNYDIGKYSLTRGMMVFIDSIMVNFLKSNPFQKGAYIVTCFGYTDNRPVRKPILYDKQAFYFPAEVIPCLNGKEINLLSTYPVDYRRIDSTVLLNNNCDLSYARAFLGINYLYENSRSSHIKYYYQGKGEDREIGKNDHFKRRIEFVIRKG